MGVAAGSTVTRNYTDELGMCKISLVVRCMIVGLNMCLSYVVTDIYSASDIGVTLKCGLGVLGN